jgi:hypothetical protein
LSSIQFEEEIPMNRAHGRAILLPPATMLALILTCLSALGQSPAAANASTPVLVELFTSEGCSSCPPADAWLQELDSSQPIPGAQAIVLSEHVDYWNHDGWKDPFSSSLLTQRQSDYVHVMGLSSPYTPQLIVDGKTELQLTSADQVEQAIVKAAKPAQVLISIGSVSVEGGSAGVLHAHVTADGSAAKHNADVFAVIALNHAESQVLHGENGGRRLSHVAVAQDIVKIGKLEKGKTFNGDYQARLKPGMDPENLRLVVFVQESGPGEVLGAAEQRVSPSAK